MSQLLALREVLPGMRRCNAASTPGGSRCRHTARQVTASVPSTSGTPNCSGLAEPQGWRDVMT